MAGKIKVKEGEMLTDDNIKEVMQLREQAKPITVKEACERLNIAANGPRLQKIIQDYKERQEEEKRRRAANRGKPANDFEVSTIVEDFLSGDSLKAIADRLYRSTDFVKRVVDNIGVPQRMSGEDYASYGPLPEQCVASTFETGDLVWSSKYGAIAEIDARNGTSINGSNLYRIYVHQRINEEKSLVDGKRFAYHVTKGGGFYANQPAEELGSLQHLRKFNVDVRRAIK